MKKASTGRKVAILLGCTVPIALAAAVTLCWGSITWWYALWRDFESLGRDVQGYSEFRHRKTGIVFVFLPGGTFLMGSPPHEAGRLHDEWEDCQRFCRVTGLSLPSEAQWEYACRAGTTTPYSTGDKLTAEDAHFYPRNPGPVDSLRPNGFGLYNMHGNVAEWCEDVYDEEFYSRAAARGPDPVCSSEFEDPALMGPAFPVPDRVARGGSWGMEARFCRSAARIGFDRLESGVGLGFRPAWGSDSRR